MLTPHPSPLHSPPPHPSTLQAAPPLINPPPTPYPHPTLLHALCSIIYPPIAVTMTVIDNDFWDNGDPVMSACSYRYKSPGTFVNYPVPTCSGVWCGVCLGLVYRPGTRGSPSPSPNTPPLPISHTTFFIKFY